jgi:UDP-N-acetylmuramate--alanine ligase
MSQPDIEILNGVKKIHLIGIGGIGMSGIAEYLAKKGYDVSGSDMTMTDITKRLQSMGVKISEGHNGEYLDKDTNLVVYTAAVHDDNSEFKKASVFGIKMIKRAEMLGHIVNGMFLIAVAGTHGKTTTTSMIAKILLDNNYDPTVFVGGNVSFLEGASSRIGDGKYAVVEADEYDRSFHRLKPDVAVITNVEYDHSDIYKDFNDMKKAFGEFCKNLKKDGKIVAYGDDLNTREVVENTGIEDRVYYGMKKNNDYRIKSIKYAKDGVKFTLEKKDVHLNLFGEHNILNASAARIASRAAGIKFRGFQKSIESYKGVQRRLELKYDGDVKVFDDYAHHPTEVNATMDALKRMKPKRIITVFQPHLYSRTRDFHGEFADALKKNDIFILAKIYPARESPLEGVTSEMILDGLSEREKKKAFYIKNEQEIYSKLYEIMKKGDYIIFQGAGTITNFCNEFVSLMERNELIQSV